MSGVHQIKNSNFADDMEIEILRAKIHRATVTESDLDYIGSIAIDQDLLDATGLIEGERVYIFNITNGERFDTYIIPGERGSGIIGINGAAAHKASKGDLIIIVAYGRCSIEEAKVYRPKVVFPSRENKI